MNGESEFDVPDDYKLLLEFHAGHHGWFVPMEVRRRAYEALQEIVWLRTKLRILKQATPSSPPPPAASPPPSP